MALPSYPVVLPTCNTIKAAERGQQNYFFTNAQSIMSTAAGGNGATYGANNLTAPVAGAVTATQNNSLTGPFVYGIPASKAHEAFAQDYMVAVDVFTSTTGASAAATVAVLGSLDGASFYKMASVAVAGTGTIFSLAAAAGAQVTNTGTATPGTKVRFLAAAIVAYGGVASTTDSVTASFIF